MHAGIPPPGSRHPPVQSMLGDTVNTRAVRILLECNLVLLCVDGQKYQQYHSVVLSCLSRICLLLRQSNTYFHAEGVLCMKEKSDSLIVHTGGS